MLRLLLWRLLGVLAILAGLALIAWFSAGGPGKLLRGEAAAGIAHISLGMLIGTLARWGSGIWGWTPVRGLSPVKLCLTLVAALSVVLGVARGRARRRRRYVRLQVEVYRADFASDEGLVTMFGALHKRLLRRWWRRLLSGQPSLALEVHHEGGAAHSAWLAISCPRELAPMVEAGVQACYPNCRLRHTARRVGVAPAVLRLKKHARFIKRVRTPGRFEQDREPAVNRLLTVMGACGEHAFVQIALTPTPALFEAFAKHLYKRHEARLSRERREHLLTHDRSMVEDAELRGGLEVQHKPLFFVDLRVIAPTRSVCERIASEIRVDSAENRLIERGTTLRHGLLGLYTRRVQRGEGNPLPSFRKGVFASAELAAMWQLPSVDYLTVPFARSGLPLAPAPPGIFRPGVGPGNAAGCPGAGFHTTGATQAEHRRAGHG